MTGVYIHLPFCRAHCTYCPFAVSTDRSLEERYVNALLREIEMRSPADRASVDTIFLGGGTPSLTQHANLRRVMNAIGTRFDVAQTLLSVPAESSTDTESSTDRSVCATQARSDRAVQARSVCATQPAEISMETNPEDISPEAIAGWRAIGVNRISIGVQSFHDSELYPLGRGHASLRARQAVRDAVDAGVRTSVDLILGLPLQSAESFRETLDVAVGLGVGHISLYMLDLEEGTALHRQVKQGQTALPDDELTSALYLEAIERLAAAGFAQYEISNFARPGEECLHNLRYWRRLSYYGFGLGAHSFLGEERRANLRDIHGYIETIESGGEPIDFVERLTTDERRRELIFLGLRQTSGLDYGRLIEFCGEEGLQWTTRGLDTGWLIRRGENVAFTPSGFLFSNEYISQLF